MARLGEQSATSLEIAPEFRYEVAEQSPTSSQTPLLLLRLQLRTAPVLALYRRFQEEGEAFKPGYLKLLSYGGSERPETILAEVGIDITDRAFWQGGFDLVRKQIDELESD